MKPKHALFFLVPALALSGCSNDVKECTMTAAYVFNCAESGGVPVAWLLFDGTRFVKNLAGIHFTDDKVIAGDRLTLKYTGDLITLESFPSQTYIENGELKGYSFIKTEIKEEKNTTAERLKETYGLRGENIILDDEGHFATIDEYEGSDYYLTFDAERVIPCPDGANCAVQRYPVAGIYAFNPRP